MRARPWGGLLDLRRARLWFTIVDVYETAKTMTKAFTPGIWCALNRGLHFRLFAEREKAEAWLREPMWDRAAV